MQKFWWHFAQIFPVSRRIHPTSETASKLSRTLWSLGLRLIHLQDPRITHTVSIENWRPKYNWSKMQDIALNSKLITLWKKGPFTAITLCREVKDVSSRLYKSLASLAGTNQERYTGKLKHQFRNIGLTNAREPKLLHTQLQSSFWPSVLPNLELY